MVNCKISVVVPYYNVASYIDRCMECLQQQTLCGIEVVCVDDGSTDNRVVVPFGSRTCS